MRGVRKSIHDIYGCALMMDLVAFKEELRDERRTKIFNEAESIRHFIPD